MKKRNKNLGRDFDEALDDLPDFRGVVVVVLGLAGDVADDFGVVGVVFVRGGLGLFCLWEEREREREREREK
jgi:hypothetical protein